MNLSEAEREIRDIINTPRRQRQIMLDRHAWFQLCASLDVLGDTQLAIASFHQLSPDMGGRYLCIYGLLQALYQQQDAIRHMAEAVGVDLPTCPQLREVRYIRNEIVGHPTKQHGNQSKPATHTISRPTLSMAGFQVVSSTHDASRLELRDISVIDLIEKQRNGATAQVALVLEHLRELERTHMNKFSDQRLVDVFPSTMQYHVSKIGEGINPTRDSAYVQLAIVNVNYVRDIVNKFVEGLTERGEMSDDWQQYEIDIIMHTLDRLNDYLTGDASITFSEDDARIYLFFLGRKLEHLRQCATEVDEEYAASSDT